MPPPGEERAVGRVATQPIRDLSLVRERAPEVLKRALANPYDQTESACPTLRGEIAELDAALGPDLQPGEIPHANTLAAELAGLVSLPFRGVVRRVTGAERRERALRAAVLAGMVRRGFLKGRLSQMNCPSSP